MSAQTHPNPAMVLPFVAMLGMIALAPLLFADWWGKHYGKVAVGLAAIPIFYYLAALHAPARVLQLALDYTSFIVLIGSLFVVSGGIHIRVKGGASPFANTIFLLVGAVAANFLGTTGASMLLIRPWIRMNRQRVAAHHVVFFIFLISNAGGCLLPMGPPLFLGFLYGVPFFWVAAKCWLACATAVGILLAMFYFVDRRNFLKAPKTDGGGGAAHETWKIDGLSNLFFLAVILSAVFVDNPKFLRETLMLAAAIGSYFSTSREVHAANRFNFHPVNEVALLFVGIFATMMPALDWLAGNASQVIGSYPTPGLFYWGSGTLSALLDNAPTYLCFLSASFGAFLNHDVVSQVQQLVASGGAGLGSLAGPHAAEIRQAFETVRHLHPEYISSGRAGLEQIQVCCLLADAKTALYVMAISLGSVFCGAGTYIGNGPNFMVKSIADHEKAAAPSFFAYIWKFTLPFLVPTLIIVWLIFLRAPH